MGLCLSLPLTERVGLATVTSKFVGRVHRAQAPWEAGPVPTHAIDLAFIASTALPSSDRVVTATPHPVNQPHRDAQTRIEGAQGKAH
jgi:hypothetical protein